MRIRFRRPMILLTFLLAIAGLFGCGGGVKQVKLPAAHPCDPHAKTYIMQCKGVVSDKGFGLSNATRPPSRLLFASGAQFGIDFAWGEAPYGAAARSYGARFGVSYLSGTSKDWTYSKLHSWANAGLGVVFVFETTANRSLSDCAGGKYDAYRASREAAALGYPRAPIYYAVDFDTSGFSLYGAVGRYFHCIVTTLGAYRSGAYGGLRTMAIARANGVHFLWQTLAWSYGHFYPGIHLYQATAERWWHGFSVDYDYAYFANYGQANAAPPPPPGPSAATVRQWRLNRNGALNRYHAARCRAPQAGPGSPAGFAAPTCRATANEVIFWQDKLWTKYHRWGCFGPGAHPKTAICRVIRPEVSWWSHARLASWRVSARQRCPGPIWSHRVHRRGSCNVLAHRWWYFNSKARRTVKLYS